MKTNEKPFLFFTIPLFLFVFIGESRLSQEAGAAEPFAFSELTPYRRALFDAVVPPPGELWTPEETARFVRNYGTRGGTLLTIGLFWRREAQDIENARSVLRTVFDCQWKNPEDHAHYGSWPKTPGATFLDENWREFIGLGLILIREYFAEHLDAALRENLDAALLRAADGAAWRSPPPDYTNIAIMSAFLMGYAGERFQRRDLYNLGWEKALVVYEMYSRDKMPGEFNSTTYYGADLQAAACWKQFIRNKRFAEAGRKIEEGLCRELAEYYHADLKTVCGPHNRAYVMSLSQSVTPTGLWLAAALDDPALAPLSEVPDGGGRHEWIYVPFYLLLRPELPKEIAEDFRRFSGPRTVDKRFTYVNGRNQHVRMKLENRWMMGTATGCTRQWSQHHPGTIHWLISPKPETAATRQPSNPEIGWLKLDGDNGVHVEQEGNKLFVRKLNSRAEKFRIVVSLPGLNESMFRQGDSSGKESRSIWKFPGITLSVNTPLDAPRVTMLPVDRNLKQEICEIVWPTPKPLRYDGNVLEIEVLEAAAP